MPDPITTATTPAPAADPAVAPAAPPQGVPPAQPAPAPAAAAPAAPPAPAPTPQPQHGTQVQDTGVLQQLLNDTRAEAADNRVKLRAEETARKAAEDALAAERLERRLEQAAARAGANPALMLPYLKGSGKLDPTKLDTTDADKLTAALDGLVAEALASQPVLKGAPAPPPTSGPGGTPPAGGQQVRNFSRREIQGMSPEQLAANLDAITDWQRRGSPGIDG